MKHQPLLGSAVQYSFLNLSLLANFPYVTIKSPEAYSPGHNHYLLTHAIYVWLTFMLEMERFEHPIKDYILLRYF